MNATTKIIHIDMDAFYASVEQRDDPSLKGKPVVVGGAGKRGVVAAASYEARKYGIHSAMPSVTAQRKCADVIFVRPRFEIYKKVSQEIREIFYRYTDLVEPLSLDEAYLDVTTNKLNMPSATLIAREIKKKIKETTQLTASAGVSINKFLAKTASDIQKPDGLTVILPKDALEFIGQLPVSKFHGVGRVTAKKMNDLGIHTGNDLRQWSQNDLARHFGKMGNYYYKISRAEDERKVNPDRIRKSISSEDTFERDLTSLDDMFAELKKLGEKVFRWMEKNNVYGKTITLKVKFSDFKQITRSKTMPTPIIDLPTIEKLSYELLHSFDSEDAVVRLLGIGISNLNNMEDNKTGHQLTLEF